MGAAENHNWLFDYGLIDDIPVPGGDFQAPATGFHWSSQALNASSSGSMEIDGSFGDSDGLKEMGSRKRVRPESCSASGSKACREKMRRDRLNDRFGMCNLNLILTLTDLIHWKLALSLSLSLSLSLINLGMIARFLELGSILESGRPPKMDKAAILSDAVRMVTQLRSEAQKLKESNESLQEKIKELKAEKNELRDEKQRLKAEKEKLEQQVKTMSAQPAFLPHPSPIPAMFAAQGQAAGNKVMPFVGYPGVAMWQFMPPAAVDTSQDHVLRPPVA